jgi:hypothetical protein
VLFLVQNEETSSMIHRTRSLRQSLKGHLQVLIVCSGHRRQIRRFEFEIRLNPEIRFRSVAFGEEETEAVDLAVLKIQSVQ